MYLYINLKKLSCIFCLSKSDQYNYGNNRTTEEKLNHSEQKLKFLKLYQCVRVL